MMDKRYWDSATFLDWLSYENSENKEKCKGVMQAVNNSEIKLVTSALTIAEVLFVKGRNKIEKESADRVCRFFENEFILTINLDRYIAEFARNLVWEFEIKPKDSIHVASAIIWSKSPVLDTFDKRLISKSGKIGAPPLKIGNPDIPHQKDMFKEKNKPV